MQHKLFLTLLSLIFLLLGTANAQEDNPENTTERCLTVDEIQQLMHMDFSSTVPFLEEKGYRLGYSYESRNENRTDTIQHILLHYTTKVYNKTSDQYSLIRIHFSQDGLCNIVEDFRSTEGSCSLDSTFRAHPLYREDRQNNLFLGNNPIGNNIEKYIVKYTDYQGRIQLIVTNVDERQAYASKLYHENNSVMLDRLNRAKLMAQHNSFPAAIRQLDSVDAKFLPSDTLLANTRQRIITKSEKYYFPLIISTGNSGEIDKALRMCDTLTSISPMKDSIQQIANILRQQGSGNAIAYCDYHPEICDSVKNYISTLVNNEIRANLSEDPQHLRITFIIQTDKENRSACSVRLWPENDTREKNRTLFEARRNIMERRTEELAKSPVIIPVKDHGITVNTKQVFDAQLKWFHFTETIVNECTDDKKDFQPFVKMVEDMYFTTYTTNHTVYGDTTIARRRLPSQREYTFGVTHKTYEGKLYIDVTLNKFNTPGAFSWMPSLIIPGLGTSRQGEPHTAALYAVPFYILAGLAVWGFSYDKSDHQTYSWDDTDSHLPWEYNNFGKITGYVCGGLAATIYISDLIHGISNSITNIKRSKSLRQRLNNGPITLQKQDVVLWP